MLLTSTGFYTSARKRAVCHPLPQAERGLAMAGSQSPSLGTGTGRVFPSAPVSVGCGFNLARSGLFDGVPRGEERREVVEEATEVIGFTQNDTALGRGHHIAIPVAVPGLLRGGAQHAQVA